MMTETLSWYSLPNLLNRSQQWYRALTSEAFSACWGVAVGPTKEVAARSRTIYVGGGSKRSAAPCF